MFVCLVKNDKNYKEARDETGGNPAGCAWGYVYSKGNIEEKMTVVSAKSEFVMNSWEGLWMGGEGEKRVEDKLACEKK